MFIIFNNFSMFIILSYNVLTTYLQKSSFNFLLILLYRKVVLNWERFSHLAFDIVQRHVWLSQLGGVGGPATSILLVVVRDAAKHSIVHRTPPSQQRIIQPKIMPKLKISGLESRRKITAAKDVIGLLICLSSCFSERLHQVIFLSAMDESSHLTPFSPIR